MERSTARPNALTQPVLEPISRSRQIISARRVRFQLLRQLKGTAEARRQEVLDRLARHEHIIARFYMKRGSWGAASQRLNFLIDEYPSFPSRDAVFFDLGETLTKLGRNGEAKLYFERVITEFPQSEYAEPARRRLGEMKA